MPVSPEPSGDSLWLSMALSALGLDSWSLLGLFLFQLLLLLLPPATTGGDRQGPTPRVQYHAGKCLMVGKCGGGHTEPETGGRRREGTEERGRKTDMEEPRERCRGEPARARVSAADRNSD